MPATRHVRPLRDMAVAACQDNIEHIRDIGDLKYYMVEDILSHIKDPSQLRDIQKRSPHLAASTADLWIAFIKRDIPSWEKSKVQLRARDPSLWCEVYYQVKADDDALLQKHMDDLKKGMDDKVREKASKRTVILANVVVPTNTYSPAVVGKNGSMSQRASVMKRTMQKLHYPKSWPPAQLAKRGPASAAMKQIMKDAEQAHTVMGPRFGTKPAPAVRAPTSTRRGQASPIDRLRETHRWEKRYIPSTRQTETMTEQGIRMISDYLEKNAAELKQRRDSETESIVIASSPRRRPSATPTSSNASSPRRAPRSALGSAACSPAGSRRSSPAFRPIVDLTAIPELNLNDVMSPTPIAMTAPVAARHISLADYTRKRKASQMISDVEDVSISDGPIASVSGSQLARAIAGGQPVDSRSPQRKANVVAGTSTN